MKIDLGLSESDKKAFERADRDPADEGVIIEAVEGVLSGGIGAVQGIAELGASGIDLIADTDYSSKVTDAADDLRRGFGKVPGLRAVFGEEGLDPTGVVGTTTELITQFAVPGLGAAGAVSKLSKAGRLQKALRSGKATALPGQGLTKTERLSLGAQQVVAAGLADAAVATDGTHTIGDFFEGGPTQTDKEVGLSGREEAVRRLVNKVKVGVEGAGATIVAPAVIGATARGVSAVGEATGVSPVVRAGLGAGARQVQKGIKKTADVLEEAELNRTFGIEQGRLANAAADVASILRYKGRLPQEVAEARSLVGGAAQAEIRKATNTLDRIEDGLDGVMKEYGKMSKQDSSLMRQNFMSDIEEFLTSPSQKRKDAALNRLPEAVRRDVQQMRGQIDGLSRDIMGSDFVKRLEGQTTEAGEDMAEAIRQSIQKNLNSYLRRRYRIFEDAKYKPDEATVEAGIAGFKSNKRYAEKELQHIAAAQGRKFSEYGLDEKGRIVGEVSDGQAKLAVENFLNRFSVKNRDKTKTFNRVAKDRLQTGMFKERENLKPFQKALLGEIKDPKEAFIGTIADLAEFRAVDDYFANIRQLASNPDSIASKMFVKTDDLTPAQIKQLENDGYQVLGGSTAPSNARNKNKAPEAEDKLASGWGSLHGYAVPQRVYDDLTRVVVGDLGVFGNALRSTYSGFLKMKGVSQFGKTVLSPVTQLRNVTTASMFALAQGNVGRGANIGESIRTVFDDLRLRRTTEEVTEELADMQRLGVVGTQTQLRELQSLIKEGFGYTDNADKFVNGFSTGRNIASGVGDGYLRNFVASTGKKATDAYQAGDDLWKIYNFKFEQNKLRNALRGMSPEEQMAFLTRTDVQNVGNVTRQTLDEAYKQEASRIVRNTVPNYNLAPEFIQGLRKLPIGNFIAFPYEILRTGINTIGRGIDELASTNAEIQKIGMRRLIGAGSTFYVVPDALTEFGYTVSGVTREEMEAYQRSAAPKWEKNARLIPVARNDDGTIDYINYSYSNPYDLLERAVTGAMNKSEEGRRLGKSGGRIALEAFNEAFAELVAPFTDEAIITEALRDVLPRDSNILGVSQLAALVGGGGGKTASGARVYNPEDSDGDKAAKSFAHVFEAMIPAVIPIDVRSGELEPSRFARGLSEAMGGEEVTGISTMDRMGRERTFQEEINRALSGFSSSEIDPARSIRFKGFEFSRARQDSANIFNSVARRQNVDSEQLLNAYNDANAARYRNFTEFYNVVQDMRTLGMTEREIRTTLKNANVGGINKLLRGEYEPFEIGRSVIQDMRRNGTFDLLPRDAIREIQRSQRNMGFGQDIDSVRSGRRRSGIKIDLGLTPTSSVSPSVAPAAPAPTTAVAAAPTAAPQVSPPAATASAGQVSPILLGGNLATQQLAAQLGRTTT